ncbi:uncharacterized protein NECHADRAFT_86482 [Fusarium vanettenii 77-13-4]|uniref:Heterokaryon incompatibility domain-containing protein n=1 Tax=Fusarium vanettenii (strain ATCC MYA-4622 / CBS 123669 / FGSC 9596 / NRRL 45880 / 77-13-4) TaxID=660122 RepID=C7ZGY2_FUSV7|nr:uncharacterized protein NECHADRAFT_86482 [Fusarium vanettenii 77-13-4]EEU36687.1 hypothetical protein NECHADRAFT_86482 [Fusarium vanettenii 77-13-4]
MTSEHSVLPHTCEHCQRILLDKPVKKEVYGQYDVTLPHTRGEVYQAVQAGCPLFSRYPKFPFFGLSVAQSLDPNSWQPWFDQPQFLRFEGWQRRSALMLAKSMLNPYDQPFEISYNTEGDFSLRCLSWVSEVDTMRIVAPPEDPAAQDIVFRPIKEQVDVEETFAFLRSQIQECYYTHCHQGTCPPPTGGFAPRRVIRIGGSTNPPSLRLYAPEVGEEVQWCALSYCWGGQNQSVMTTLATLQERYDGIDFGSLPRTLQDAITTTHRLEIQYIWIDSLCIVQDDGNEKAQDIAQMGDVYSLAYITLSASSASTVTEGFLQNRSIPQPLTPIALRYVNESGVEGTIIATSEPIPEGMPDPINSRAWTFQERVLSPRLVDFSSTQVRWRCNSAERCDSGCPPRTTWKVHFETSWVVDGTSNPSRTLTDIQEQWNHLVTAYSQRNLTYPADKLIAFSAIPKTLGRPGRYLAGLWETDLPCNLLWKVTHLWFPSSGTVDKRKAKLETYHAPSWSWASVDGEVECKLGVESSMPEATCEVLDVQVDLANDDAPFGAVVSGYIIIRGNTRHAVFYPSMSELFFYEPGTEEGDEERQTARYEGFADCKPDKDMTAAQSPSVNVCCLHIRNFGGRGEGLLLVEDGKHNVFRRIGHFYWNLEDLGNSFQSSENAEVMVV